MQGHRIEGRDKVTGRAAYVDDLRPEAIRMQPLIALVATSPKASGRIRVDASAALALPGTRCVVDHTNAPHLKKAFAPSLCEPGTLLPLQSDQIHYAGQAIAIVVAESLQAARDALNALVVDVEDERDCAVTLADGADRLAPVKHAGIGPGALKRGDADAAYAAAEHRVELETHAAPHHQNPMEPGAVIARWDDDGGVTLHAAVQWHHIDTAMIGQAFGLGWREGMPSLVERAALGKRREGKVRLHNHLSGGAFGRNISYVALLLAPMAAKVAGAPVKLVHSRRDTFSLMSHRSEVIQRLRIGADAEGKLDAIVLEPDIARGNAAFVEPIGEMPMQMYAHKTHRLTTRVAKLDLPGAGWMRGPGVAHAMFVLEQGMDALARKTGMDPLDLRIANHADVHPVSGKPWEAKALREAYEESARRFGWRDRPPGGTARDDGRLMGFGMSSSIDLGRQFPAHAHVTFTRDARVVVSLAIAEMGQGLLTGLTGLVSEMTGIAPERIELARGSTGEGYAAGSIGSTGTFSNAAAIEVAIAKIRSRLAKAVGFPAKSRLVRNALIAPDGRRVDIADILAKTGALSAKGRTGLTFGATSKTAKASFGAVFCEVAVDALTLDVEVVRLVGAYDCGRVLQPKIARAQLVGAMIMGIGQALMEETRLDRQSGHWTNAEIGEALIPTQADCPHVEAHFVGEAGTPGTLDFKGIAETAIVGPAPAIAAAFADATGGVVNALPITHARRLAAVPHHTANQQEAAE